MNDKDNIKHKLLTLAAALTLAAVIGGIYAAPGVGRCDQSGARQEFGRAGAQPLYSRLCSVVMLQVNAVTPRTLFLLESGW